MKLHPDRIAAGLFIALAAVIAFDSRRLEILPVGPGTLPMLVAVLLALTAGRMLTRPVEESPSGGRSTFQLSMMANPLYVAVCIALYTAGVAFVGYLASTFLLVMAMMARLSSYRILHTVALALLVSVLSYYTFTKLGMHLPGAWLEDHLP